MEGESTAAGAFVDSSKDISGPLDVRRLQGNARCSRCKVADRDCYLERTRQGADLYCLFCRSAEECHFRRIVVKEGAASTFTWDELLGDDPDLTAISPSPAAVNHRKRPYSAIGDAHHQQEHSFIRPSSNRPLHINPSLISEPVSHDRSHISTSQQPKRTVPFGEDSLFPLDEASAYLNNTGTWHIPGFDRSLAGDDAPYFAGDTLFGHRLDSVVGELNDFTNSFDDLVSPYSLQPPSIPTVRLSPLSGLMWSATEAGSADPKSRTVGSQSRAPATLDKCPICAEELNTRSEAKKHMARHTKPFLCDIDGCPRSLDGFATRNDLDRHKASVHDTSHGVKLYKCAVPGCKDPNKVWSRKDNFKAHLKRMHADVDDVDEYLEKSVVKPDTGPKDTPMADHSGVK